MAKPGRTVTPEASPGGGLQMRSEPSLLCPELLATAIAASSRLCCVAAGYAYKPLFDKLNVSMLKFDYVKYRLN